MAVIDWPEKINRRGSESWFLRGGSGSYGPGLNGRETVTFTENRSWTGTVTMSVLWRELIPMHRALVSSLRGRSGVARMTICNRYSLTYSGDLAAFLTAAGVSASDQAAGFIPFLDTATFSDGSGYALPESTDPTSVVAVVAGLSAMQVDGYIGRGAIVGTYFSINDFLYEVETNVDGATTFNPPLREAVSAGQTINMNAPSILVRFANDEVGRLFERAGGIAGAINLEFTEVFER